MNVIYDEKLNVRTTQFSPDEIYSLSDLNFYIPNSFNSYNVFVVLSNNQMNDICRLNYIKASSGYKIYGFTYEQNLRISNGECSIGIILISTDITDMRIGKTISFKLDNRNYALLHQLYVTQEFGAKVETLYEKIVKMTDMNVKIYESLINGGKL